MKWSVAGVGLLAVDEGQVVLEEGHQPLDSLQFPSLAGFLQDLVPSGARTREHLVKEAGT